MGGMAEDGKGLVEGWGVDGGSGGREQLQN